MTQPRGNILIKRTKDVLVSDENMHFFLSKVKDLRHENRISCYRSDWKNITKRSIDIIRNKITSIEDSLIKKLNLQIITEDIRKNGNSLYEAIRICPIRTQMGWSNSVNIIFEMMKWDADTPLALLLQLVASIKPRNLHENREKFVSEAINLPRHEATRLWDDELH